MATVKTPSRTIQQPLLAGHFSYSLVRRNRPYTLATWRATSPTPRTAQHLAELLGGHSQPDPESGHIEVITTTDSLDILLPGPEALDILWSSNPSRHTCDGTIQRDPQDVRPCTCPADLTQRKTSAWRGDGCTPRTLLRFQLRQAPELGTFAFANGTWAFANDAVVADMELQRSRTPTHAQLRLVRRAIASAREPDVVCTTPTLTVFRVRATTAQRRQRRRTSQKATRGA